jgi:ATP-dependent RNA/DNA helicase IGHMBP2
LNLEHEVRLYTEKTLPLLEKERAAEIEETRTALREQKAEHLQLQGRCLTRLKIVDEAVGLGGRVSWRLNPTRPIDLPAHRLQSGDVAEVRSMKDPHAVPATGVITQVRYDSIQVSLDAAPDQTLAPPLRVDRVANDTTYRRLKEALGALGSDEHRRHPLLRLAFGDGVPQAKSRARPATGLEELNTSQQRAVQRALVSEDLFLIHGPPGTGKTTTLVELAAQLVGRGERLLIAAPSNTAVDHLARKLLERGIPLVRLGHPARLLPGVVEHSLDALVEASDARRHSEQARRDLSVALRRLQRARDHESRTELRGRVRDLRGELRKLERQGILEVFSSARVVLATTVGAGDPLLRGQSFDRTILDEAAQALEPAAWIALLRSERAILAGDHCQLPPTILSREAAAGGLGATLFERLLSRFGDQASQLLDVQYRMHRVIMEFPSREFYAGQLVAHDSVAGHRLCDLEGIEESELTTAPLWFIDTAGCDFDEVLGPDGQSRSNPGEARLVVAHVQRLLDAGLTPDQVAVITPYNAQVHALREALDLPGLEIDSVDGFQGREKEAVVISLVRCNRHGELGFLRDDRRTNVAITRARRHLAVIGDSGTLAQHGLFGRWMEFCQESTCYRSAWEFLTPG